MKRFLSGIQPTGNPHLGNYFGAIEQHIALQDEGECLYFIADYHALTTVTAAAELRALSREVALTYLALGLDPARAVLFRQSDVPEVTELAWVLSCVTGKGLLDRAHSYKDKVARGIDPNLGLYIYPVLMAADILIYDSDVVPVGDDQGQHLEMTRDMARSFNARYGEGLLKIPETRLSRAPRVPGTDGQKMSKSYGNTIELFAEGKALKQAVMGIKTDSTPVAAPKNPETCTAFNLFSLLADDTDRSAMEARYRAGGLGYGEVKKDLLARIEAKFAPARKRRAQLAARPDDVEDVLAQGAKRARPLARVVVDRVRAACGLGR